jgi:hypothetical protein
VWLAGRRAVGADPREAGGRYAEANRKGRGERAISDTEIAAMLIASFRSFAPRFAA